jgi:CBS domain-containing protein
MSNIQSVSVSSFATRNVKTETEDQNILAACRIMHENNIGSVLIVDKDKYEPTGIITERDVVRLLGSLDISLLNVPLRDIMSKPLITISMNSSIRDSIQTMQHKNIRRLVITDGERMFGIITEKDIFRAIISNEDLIPSLLGDKLLIEHKTVYDQFGQY